MEILDDTHIPQVVIDLTKQSLLNIDQLTISASGWSMFPTILPGYLITIQRGEFQNIKIGDIILFDIKQQIIAVHRVLRISEISGQPRLLFTKGDARWNFDSPVSELNYIGVVRNCGKGERFQLLWNTINNIVSFIQIKLDSIRMKYQPQIILISD